MTQIPKCIYCGRTYPEYALRDSSGVLVCVDRDDCIVYSNRVFKADPARAAEARERAEAEADGTLDEYLAAATEGTPGHDRYVRSRERQRQGQFDWGLDR